MFVFWKWPAQAAATLLQALQKVTETQKRKLEANLQANQSISKSDETWLDGAGNLVYEEHVINVLENASDYERGACKTCDLKGFCWTSVVTHNLY